MGNRGGCLHDENQQIRRYQTNQHWIICKLEFKERHRSVMSPHRYTELFFLDEAVALAAGHRPCVECSRERFQSFRQFWLQARSNLAAQPVSAPEIDQVLDSERLNPYIRDWRAKKRTYTAPLSELPTGTFITRLDRATPFLVLPDKLLKWDSNRYAYGAPVERPADEQVRVLTPATIVKMLSLGYPVQIKSEV